MVVSAVSRQSRWLLSPSPRSASATGRDLPLRPVRGAHGHTVKIALRIARLISVFQGDAAGPDHPHRLHDAVGRAIVPVGAALAKTEVLRGRVGDFGHHEARTRRQGRDVDPRPTEVQRPVYRVKVTDDFNGHRRIGFGSRRIRPPAAPCATRRHRLPAEA